MTTESRCLSEKLNELIGQSFDYADAYLQAASHHGLHFEDGRLEEVGSSGGDGMGIRVLQGDHTVFACRPGRYTAEALDLLHDVAERAGGRLSRASCGGKGELLEVPEGLAPTDAGFLSRVDGAIRKESPKVRQVTLRYSKSVRQVRVFRPDGNIAEDQRSYCSFSADVVLESAGGFQTGHAIWARGLDEDLFWKGRDPEELGMEALQRAFLLLEADPCPAGTMPVVLAGSAGGTMIHEACGHGLEADVIQKDFSVYRDQLGAQVASPLVNLVDDGTLFGLYGSIAVDDEGTPAQRTILIKNGVLQNYLTDISTARRGGLPLTGNGRRQSYRYPPVPRMTNTFVLPGDREFGDIVQEAWNGLLVRKMGGGEVDPTTGNFVFHVTEGFLIEKGEVTRPVKGAILTGNGPKVLQRIRSIGKDLCFDPGVCGKAGQAVPVTDGQPCLLLDEVVVGGSDISHGSR